MAPRKVGMVTRLSYPISTRARQRWFCICRYLAKPGLDIQQVGKATVTEIALLN